MLQWRQFERHRALSADAGDAATEDLEAADTETGAGESEGGAGC